MRKRNTSFNSGFASTASRQQLIMTRADSANADQVQLADYTETFGPPSSEPKNATKFTFSPSQLSDLISSRSLPDFYSLGGVTGLAEGLRTDVRSGLSVDELELSRQGWVSTATSEKSRVPKRTFPPLLTETHYGSFSHRRKVFGDNYLPPKKPPTIFQLIWMAYNDQVLFLLTGAAVVSLALGLYQTFATAHTPDNPPVEWVEGVSILVAIIIIVLFSAGNDYQKQRQFEKLNQKKNDRNVKVVRSGRSQEISINDLVAGDILHVETGDVIPADGVLVSGYRVGCDESSATGESDLVWKQSGDETYNSIRDDKDWQKMDPFLISGTRVVEGVGAALVLATGTRSMHGRIISSLDEEPDPTPLQSRLDTLAKYIARFGGITALLMFVVLFIKFLASLPHSTETPAEKGQAFLNIFIIALTVVVIAVPEGLPLTVTLALAFATTRMLRDNNLVRQLRACETMGNATDICSDKTGTLTQNKMTVICGCFGSDSQFDDHQLISDTHLEANGDAMRTADYVKKMSKDVTFILRQSIVANSTAIESVQPGEAPSFLGSNTEAALLRFSREFLGMGQLDLERANIRTVELFPFDASRRYMAAVVQLEDTHYRIYVKGAPEMLLNKCTKSVANLDLGLEIVSMADDTVQQLQRVIEGYAARSLRTLGLCFRDLEYWPLEPKQDDLKDDPSVLLEGILQDLVLLGVVGIQDPLREGARDSVQACQKAGIVVRMVTGDNVSTARAIAEACGIISSEEDVVMEGHEFRQLTESQQDDIIPHVRVLARSLPEDKRILVSRLKATGRVVAVTGDGTNDAPALATADIGFSMGISGTEIAREASSIVLMDDNFSSIVKAVMWGRAVGDAIKKFLQFQITITITSVGLAFVSAIVNAKEQSVLTAVQLMWVNLFQDTLAALALATDPPPPRILNRNPEAKSAPLVTIPMWKMIIGQSIYQLAVTFVLHFAGSAIFNYHTDLESSQLRTAVFNTYVWLQIFNMYNNRQLENSLNIFEGMFHNWLFITISSIMIGGQVLIVFVGGDVFSVVRLTGPQWAYSVVLGALCIPFGFLIRMVPDFLVEKLLNVTAKAFVFPMRIFRRDSS